VARNRPIPHLSDEDKAFVRSLIIHEDEAVLAFNKPSGLPSQVRGNKARNLDHLLWAFAKSNGKRPRLVHRLDTGTSGVIIAGKTKPAATALATAFEKRNVKKTYLAVVSGALPASERGIIDAPIARVETDRGANMVAGHPDGKPSITRWNVLWRAGNFALLELLPETGRTHQIRVHLAHIGCPILGDHIYGDKASAPRLMLHALRLQMPHPNSDVLSIETPAPESFKVESYETR